MPVTLFDIVKYFEDERNTVKKGEDAVLSNHIIKIEYDGEIKHMEGVVQASMRNRSYNVKIDLDDAGAVIHAQCTCARGNFKCHHIAALLIYGHKNISATSSHCRWSRVRPADGDKPTKAEDLFPPTKQYRATTTPLGEEEIKKFQEKLCRSEFNIGFTWFLSPEPAPLSVAEVPAMEKLLLCEDYSTSSDKVEYLKRAASISQEDILRVAHLTKGQCENPLWFIARKYRLTSSNFGKVLSACKRRKFVPSLYKQLRGDYNLSTVRSLQWGRENEVTALRCLEIEEGITVEQTGLWLHKSGFLGASPDGIVRSENAIVEIKCPYSFRKSESIVESIRESKGYILQINDDNQMVVNTDHDYYHQIQGQLHISGATKCYLVYLVI